MFLSFDRNFLKPGGLFFKFWNGFFDESEAVPTLLSGSEKIILFFFLPLAEANVIVVGIQDLTRSGHGSGLRLMSWSDEVPREEAERDEENRKDNKFSDFAGLFFRILAKGEPYWRIKDFEAAEIDEL